MLWVLAFKTFKTFQMFAGGGGGFNLNQLRSVRKAADGQKVFGEGKKKEGKKKLWKDEEYRDAGKQKKNGL